MPFFSIITASLNSSKTLGDTLGSAAAQTFRDFEHIVIDGGSKDDTLCILQDFGDRYNLRWISEPDAGISDALNKGLNLSTGTYFLVLQSDDMLADNNTLERVHEMVDREHYDIYSYPVLVSLPDGSRKLHGPSRAPRIRYHFKNIFRHQGTFIHKRVHDLVGPYQTDLAISMDYDLFYRALNHGCSYAIGDFPVAVMGASGISRTQSFQRILEEVQVQRRNERSQYWRAVQFAFRSLYLPYRRVIHNRESRKGGLPALDQR